MIRPEILFFDGDFVRFEDARVHVLAPAVKFAVAVHEGVAAYEASDESIVLFRLHDHLRRLQRSAELVDIGLPNPIDEMVELVKETVSRNRDSCRGHDFHVRISLTLTDPDGFVHTYGAGTLTIAPIPRKVSQREPLSVAISSWRRTPDVVSPPRVKAAANYLNGRLALLDARRSGYDDAVLLDLNGKLSEGPGYNIFLVRDGSLLTPPVTDSILEGVTRATVLTLAQEAGIPTEVRSLDASELHYSEEAFFCGTWKEIAPIRLVSGRALPEPVPGPITSDLMDQYMRLVRGADTRHESWLTRV